MAAKLARLLGVLLAVLALAAVMLVKTTPPARAVTMAPGAAIAAAAPAAPAAPVVLAAVVTPAGDRALNWAQAHALNHTYSWGGSGLGTYDCSGLVMTAFARATGILLPHNTVAMVDSGRLHRVWGTPQRGDLAFWGSPAFPYHVEFVTSWRTMTFGTENTTWAGRVTWHSDAFSRPSSYWRVW
jgi:peptidoglycan DL-endopeptidase CwlO